VIVLKNVFTEVKTALLSSILAGVKMKFVISQYSD